MPIISKRMTELDYCVVCGRPVPLERDPSICSGYCLEVYEAEVAFNKAVKKELHSDGKSSGSKKSC